MKVPNVTIVNTHNGMLYPNAISYIDFNNILTEIMSFGKLNILTCNSTDTDCFAPSHSFSKFVKFSSTSVTSVSRS
jgi:hypothetical protein